MDKPGKGWVHGKRWQGDMLGEGRPEKEEGANSVGRDQRARQHEPCFRGPLGVKETPLTNAPKAPSGFQSGFHRPAPQALCFSILTFLQDITEKEMKCLLSGGQGFSFIPEGAASALRPLVGTAHASGPSSSLASSEGQGGSACTQPASLLRCPFALLCVQLGV